VDSTSTSSPTVGPDQSPPASERSTGRTAGSPDSELSNDGVVGSVGSSIPTTPSYVPPFPGPSDPSVATTTTPRTDERIPVTLAVLDTGARGSNSTVAAATLTLDHGCVWISYGDDPPFHSSRVVWPAGTTFDRAAYAIALPDGSRLRSGDRISIPGAFVADGDLANIVGQRVYELALRCVAADTFVVWGQGIDDPLTPG